MLKLNHMSYSVDKKQILSDVSVELHDHEITCLIGPNGVGKSTILNLITKQIKPISGQLINDIDNMALLAQHNALFEPLTVHELLTIQSNDMDEEIVNLLQLTDLLDNQLDELSGGQRQLAWLGYVLHQKPELLLLDEPTTYLDLRYQHLFLNALMTLQKSRGFTVLMVLHDLTQAFNVSKHIWLMHDQKIHSGLSEHMLNEDILSQAFGVPLKKINDIEQTVIVTNTNI